MLNRRDFLRLKRRHDYPDWPHWSSFTERVRRIARGPWQELTPERLAPEQQAYDSKPMMAAPQAVLRLERWHEFEHIRQMCLQYEVSLLLWGAAARAYVLDRPVLWLQISEDLAEWQSLSDQACLATSAVSCGELLQQGFQQFRRVPDHLSLGQWLASPAWHDVRPGLSYLSGVERIEVFFANGDHVVLGGFGVHDKAPLNTALLNRSIPQLFNLLQQSSTQTALTAEYWHQVYRLDSLANLQTESNLARLFLGHRGTLIWLKSLVLRKMPYDDLLLPEDVPDFQREASYSDAEIKSLFDSQVLFPYLDELEGD
ncbi:hypothetical protein [Brackiella oedipodis]|uniref:hypothetical protein n=1 Tax=Brackiella oedipodis TaxID=124225 RepID=UPI0004901265|nr:hypothetical protein [Brackiella oedipodis]